MSTNLNRLDQLDVLLVHFRPIEQLFRLMEVAGVGDESELVRSCAEIGQALATRFREVLEKEMSGTEGGTTWTRFGSSMATCLSERLTEGRENTPAP